MRENARVRACLRWVGTTYTNTCFQCMRTFTRMRIRELHMGNLPSLVLQKVATALPLLFSAHRCFEDFFLKCCGNSHTGCTFFLTPRTLSSNGIVTRMPEGITILVTMTHKGEGIERARTCCTVLQPKANKELWERRSHRFGANHYHLTGLGMHHPEGAHPCAAKPHQAPAGNCTLLSTMGWQSLGIGDHG